MIIRTKEIYTQGKLDELINDFLKKEKIGMGIVERDLIDIKYSSSEGASSALIIWKEYLSEKQLEKFRKS